MQKYDVQFTSVGPSLKRRTISSGEKLLGVKLPKNYAQFLESHNGGIPKPRYFHLVTGLVVGIRRFLSLSASRDEDDLVATNDRLRKLHRVPSQFLAIAVVDNDGFVLIDTHGGRSEDLYLWTHTKGGFRLSPPGSRTAHRLYFVMSEFLFKLGPANRRTDLDGLCFRVAKVRDDPKHGPATIRRLVGLGHDINYVVKGQDHPVFDSIKLNVVNVIETMIDLGLNEKQITGKGKSVSVVAALERQIRHEAAFLDVLVQQNNPFREKCNQTIIELGRLKDKLMVRGRETRAQRD